MSDGWGGGERVSVSSVVGWLLRECGGEPHEPCGCELWAQWLEHVQTMQPKIGEYVL